MVMFTMHNYIIIITQYTAKLIGQIITVTVVILAMCVILLLPTYMY